MRKGQILIYVDAMRNIIQMILSESPSYNFSIDGYDNISVQKKKNFVLESIIDYINRIAESHSDTELDTYSMIICGTIMQANIAGISLDEEFFNALLPQKIDQNMRIYFEDIYKAIRCIHTFYYFKDDEPLKKSIDFKLLWDGYYDDDERKELFKKYGSFYSWPFLLKSSFHYEESSAEFRRYLMDAIRLCPDFSYAYCLLFVTCLNMPSNSSEANVLSFKFADQGADVKEVVAKTHSRIGNKLFCYLFSGNYPDIDNLILNYELDYFLQTGKEFADNERFYLKDGYIKIDEKLYPAGIPYFRRVTMKEYYGMMEDTVEFISENQYGVLKYYPSEYIQNNIPDYLEDGVKYPISNPTPRTLTDQGVYRLEYKEYAVFAGYLHMMPCFNVSNEEALKALEGSNNHSKLSEADKIYTLNQETETIGKLLDMTASEIDRLKKLNNELEITNQQLNRHMRLNTELVRSLSHSSANYLNSEKLAETGIELRGAKTGDPTLEKIRADGLLLLLQSEHESFMRRRLDSLVIRCSADGYELKQSIRRGLTEQGGKSIIAPLDYALKTILFRLLTRDNDIRSQHMKDILHKTDAVWENLKYSFISDVLANESQGETLTIEWCKKNICDISIAKSDEWKKLNIIEDGAFYDLIVEVVSEQLLNAFTHGNVEDGINIEFGKSSEDAITFKGKTIPRWAFISCMNTICGQQFKGSKQNGISTLNETMLLLNGNKRGLEVKKEKNHFTNIVWFELDMLRVLKN